ncbi:diheme cytochrome c-553 [Flaviaesturariibacter amylovorans]|uniref:Cytochrome c domain-containing protein n=1 Tax=Flaviaesturariibacter amylovorans TaxID=1084520 RepID=A0ABP8GJN5_9BACT
MKKTLLSLGAIAFVTLGALVACNADQKPSEKTEGLVVAGATTPSADEMIARGRYLVTIMGCGDCHTPKIMTAQGPAPDTAHLLGGHPAQLSVPAPNQEALKSWVLFSPTLTAYAGPWGVSYAANISSDESGIGNWSEEQFFRAMREGKYKGLPNGRPLLPPMPWQQFAQATDEDLRAIFSFLKSTQPVANVVPAAAPPTAAK